MLQIPRCSFCPTANNYTDKLFTLHMAECHPQNLLNDVKSNPALVTGILHHGAPIAIKILGSIPDFLSQIIELDPVAISLIMKFKSAFLIQITEIDPDFWTVVAKLRPDAILQAGLKPALLYKIMTLNTEFLPYVKNDQAFIDLLFKNPQCRFLARNAGYAIEERLPLTNPRETYLIGLAISQSYQQADQLELESESESETENKSECGCSIEPPTNVGPAGQAPDISGSVGALKTQVIDLNSKLVEMTEQNKTKEEEFHAKFTSYIETNEKKLKELTDLIERLLTSSLTTTHSCESKQVQS